MINVGVIGLGMMGLTHLDVYSRRSDAQVIAISDKLPERLEGKTKAAGNIEGMAKGGFDYASVRKYPEGMDLIHAADIQIVDICLPTPMHLEYALAALAAGKHVLIEKPLCRTAEQAEQLVTAAKKAKGMSMVAMCMRFWPGWTWLKEVIEKGTYGKVLSAHFRRLASHPGGAFYSNGELSGGAILDLHIHDTDFVQFLFGMPKGVSSSGYRRVTSEHDHIVTEYHYDDVPLVVAEGAWCMAGGFPFTMQYIVNFEQATAVFELGEKHPLMLYQTGQSPQPIEVAATMGYEHEIAYFLDCVAKGTRPQKVTLEDGLNALRIIEAEKRSADEKRPVALR